MKNKADTSTEASLSAAEATPSTGEMLVSAVHAGTREAKAAAATLGFSWSRGVYRLAYSVSYGVVYGALALTRWIPAPDAVAEGIRDGASAAGHDFAAHQDAASTKSEAGLATA
jgi:hypothetical protein